MLKDKNLPIVIFNVHYLPVSYLIYDVNVRLVKVNRFRKKMVKY